MILNDGIPLELRDGKLFLHGAALQSSQRTAQDMRDVSSPSSAEEIIYLMYRNIFDKRHAELIAKHKIRHDITIIFPKMLGNEFSKTLGHYHSISKTVSYTEVYEVLAGKAHFLLQKVSGNKVEDAVVLEANEGDAVIVPNDYGHMTINPTTEILAVSDLQSTLAAADYQPIKNLRGAAYFETKRGFVKNTNYTNHILRILKAGHIKAKYFGSKKPLYSIFVEAPEKFKFLNEPENFLELMRLAIAG